MLFRFRRMRPMDPLQVAMTGVRMGERYLQLFCSDAVLTRGLATKTGLSGVAALAAPDETHAARARSAAAKAGVLIDLRVTPSTSLPWDKGFFDMVVVDETGGTFSSLGPDARRATLLAVLDMLRQGGRVEIIERVGDGRRGGSTDTRNDYVSAGGAEGALREAGFSRVRTLAERDGFRFVEGLTPQFTSVVNRTAQ